MTRALIWLVIGGLVAAAVHLGSILALPLMANRTAAARLASVQTDGTFHLLTARDGILPQPDPAIVMAICRYDLSRGPVHVHAPISFGFLSVSLYTAQGLSFYALHDRAIQTGAIDLTVYTSAQLADARARQGPDTAENLRIEAPGPEGFVTIRALAREATEAAPLADSLKQASCSQP